MCQCVTMCVCGIRRQKRLELFDITFCCDIEKCARSFGHYICNASSSETLVNPSVPERQIAVKLRIFYFWHLGDKWVN